MARCHEKFNGFFATAAAIMNAFGLCVSYLSQDDHFSKEICVMTQNMADSTGRQMSIESGLK